MIRSVFNWRAGMLFVLMIVGFRSGALAQEPLPLPGGLNWGDSPARLVEWARRSKLDQLVKEPGGNRRLAILMISSPAGKLPGHEASTMEARFLDGRLYEVALHYSYPGESADFVRSQFAALKELLTVRHGAFAFDGKEQTNRDGIVSKSEAFKVSCGKERLLMLALTEVRDAKRGDAAARFSVIYHNDSILMEEGKRLEVRGGGLGAPEAESDPG